MRGEVIGATPYAQETASLLVVAAQALSGDSSAARADVVPGMMRCAKCSFVLVRNVLHAQSGAITAGDNKTEPCPNGCGPLWPMTWRQNAEDMALRCEEQVARAVAAEARCAALEADKARLDYLDEANIRLNAKYGTTYRWRLVMNHNVNRLMLGDQDVDLQDSEPNALRSCRLAIDEKMREHGRATWEGPLLDALRPMSKALKNRTPVLARFKPEIPGRADLDRFGGLWVVIRHPGIDTDGVDEGLDEGWGLAGPFGLGGLDDDWFAGWTPLPFSDTAPPNNPPA
jgi:hypothetical protein